MKQLEADIKKGVFRKIYVLYGTQDYLKKRCINAIVTAHLPKDDRINLSYFYGRKIDLKEVTSLCDTMPFMAEKRLIVLENTELFSRSSEELADYIPLIPDSTIMIFSEEKIDARLRQTKAVKAEGGIAEFSNLSEKELRDWILGKLSREHRPITRDALDLFLQRCSDDMWQISNELEKLISYTFGKDGIRPQDVEDVCAPRPEDRIFSMIDAILAGNTKKALGFYTDLLALRSDPMGILALLRDQFRLLLHVRQFDGEHVDYKDAARILGMREARVRMALPAARKSSKISLVRRIEMIADTDERIKNGRIDPQIGIETLIIGMSGQS